MGMKFRIDKASDSWGIHTSADAEVPAIPDPPLSGVQFAGWTRFRIPLGDPHRNSFTNWTPIWTIEVNDLSALMELIALAESGLIVARPPDPESDFRLTNPEWQIAAAERELPSITIYDSYVE